jgi:uncharacterized protein (TIGR02452 family)
MKVVTLGKLLCAVSSITLAYGMEYPRDTHTDYQSGARHSQSDRQQSYSEQGGYAPSYERLPYASQPSVIPPQSIYNAYSYGQGSTYPQVVPIYPPVVPPYNGYVYPPAPVPLAYPMMPFYSPLPPLLPPQTDFSQITHNIAQLRIDHVDSSNEGWVVTSTSTRTSGDGEWVASSPRKAKYTSDTPRSEDQSGRKVANKRAAREVSLMTERYKQFYPNGDTSLKPIPLTSPASAQAFSYQQLSGTPLKAQYTTLISTSRDDSFKVAASLVKSGAKIGVLNAANAKYVGGSFINGAEAQEESLCRASTLFYSLVANNTAKPFIAKEEFKKDKTNIQYTQNIQTTLTRENGVLISPQVTVFRKREGGHYINLPNSFDVTVVSSAAENIKGHRKTTHYGQNNAQKIESQLAAFAQQGVQSIVLCGWGCGSFGNQPSDIAPIYAQLLQGKYQGMFKEVIFALPDQNVRREFKIHLKSKGIKLS